MTEIRALMLQRTQPLNSSSAQAAFQELRTQVPHCKDLELQIFIRQTNDVFTNGPSTGSRAEYAAAIQMVKAAGLKVIIRIKHRPSTWGTPGQVGYVPVVDKALWLQTYSDAVVYWAAFCEQQGVDLFIIGVECMQGLETYTAEWDSLIQRVRAVYSGPISYLTSYWGDLAKRAEQFSRPWYGNLDYLALSTYWDLATAAEPTVGWLIAAWHSWPRGWDMQGDDIVHDHVQAWSQHYGRPVIIVSGLCSAYGACMTPWAYGEHYAEVAYNALEQNNWYDAILNVFSGEPWVAGFIFDGSWTSTPNRPVGKEFTLQGKPAAAVVESWFAAMAPIPTPYILSVESTPITGILFTLNGAAAQTPYSTSLEEGTYVLTMPSNVAVGADTYNFVQWQDGVTSPSRTVNLVADTVLTVSYERLVLTAIQVHAFVDEQPVAASGIIAETGQNFQTPATMQVDPGTYTVNCTFSDVTKSKTVEVVAGQTLRLDFDLTPKPESPFNLGAALALGGVTWLTTGNPAQAGVAALLGGLLKKKA